MNFRVGILAWVSVAFITTSLLSRRAAETPPPIAKVLVWVRDVHGAPVPGLRAEEFAVTENGVSDRVVGLERFSSGTQIQSQNAASRPTGSTSGPSQSGDDSAGILTHILVLLAPMPAEGRSHAIADALRFFSKRPAGNWNIALVDDEGNFLRYSQELDRVRAALSQLERHYAPYAKFSAWYGGVQSAIRELGVLPGRHVILLISSRNGMPPSTLIGSAVSAQAAMYTIESEGPATRVPFGGAAEVQNFEAGPIPFVTGEYAVESLSSALSIMGYTDTRRGQFVQAADETGGLSVDDAKDAFEHIFADAPGYYLVSFEAKSQARDGTWNAFSITVKRPHLNVKGPRYYMLPLDAGVGQIPSDMRAALESGQNPKGISVVANSWLFPDQGGVHWGVFAADVNWNEGTPPKGSRVKIYAELTNESMPGLSGAWLEEKAWPTQLFLHWQREARVYPGSYQLRVTAMDMTSREVASGTATFMARPLDVPAFRFSAIVLADACLPSTERAAMRQSLFDPLLFEGCKLAPAAGARFRSDENVRIVVRMYPPNEKLSRLVLAEWKSYVVVDDALDKTTELTITAAEVRGLNVSGILPLNRLDLAPGKHQLAVLFVLPDHNTKGQKIPLRTEFSIER